jgi:hypothetical protein
MVLLFSFVLSISQHLFVLLWSKCTNLTTKPLNQLMASLLRLRMVHILGSPRSPKMGGFWWENSYDVLDTSGACWNHTGWGELSLLVMPVWCTHNLELTLRGRGGDANLEAGEVNFLEKACLTVRLVGPTRRSRSISGRRDHSYSGRDPPVVGFQWCRTACCYGSTPRVILSTSVSRELINWH